MYSFGFFLLTCTMELGCNSPLIVAADADLDRAAELATITGFANAGQVCISAQRLLVMDKVHGDFLDALKPKVEAITTGNQLEVGTKMGPMIREATTCCATVNFSPSAASNHYLKARILRMLSTFPTTLETVSLFRHF